MVMVMVMVGDGRGGEGSVQMVPEEAGHLALALVTARSATIEGVEAVLARPVDDVASSRSVRSDETQATHANSI